MNVEQPAVARAAHAARRGDLTDALQLLDGLETPEAVDLRGRVLAQLGRWQEADQAWSTLSPAGELTTSHLHSGTGVGVGATASRALAQKVLAGRVRQRPVARPLAAAAIAVLAVGGIGFGTAAAVSHPDQLVAEPQVSASPTPPQVQPQTVMVTVTPTPPTDEAARLDAIATAVAMPGVSVRREPGAVRIVFDRGVFSSGTTLSPGSTELIDRLAPKLQGVPGITVVGQSVAVPGGEASGGSGTALARARVVAQRLARTGHLPLTRLTLASGDQAHPLFPGQPRNRTVSLLLTP
ncbi:hypothetical protein ACFVWG_09745 [Kribbella sp. NPDC058245]|uniref:hypothetical protein n=1 Tax=Kribbella sp. NPDC058245 TaxID=3346399 RepID=UPI0036F0D55F